jgi:hypothetical protein
VIGTGAIVNFINVIVAKIVSHAHVVAPPVGSLAIVAALQLGQSEAQANNDASWAWRLAITALLSVFVTLCGVVYKDLKDAQTRSDERAEKIIRQQNRMMGVITVLAVSQKGEGSDIGKLMEMVQCVMDD